MGITNEQKADAEARQWTIAQDPASHVRLVAGPGTGKTHAIQKKVLEVLRNGAIAENVYVISFTRATCAELKDRITKFCSEQGWDSNRSYPHFNHAFSWLIYIASW